MPSGQDADTKSQTCLDQVRGPVAQPPVQASQEASLEIQRAQAAGRPCYEAERTPLAVENSVGKPAANLAPNVGSGKESVAHSHPPFGPCLAARLGRDYLFFGGAALRIEKWELRIERDPQPGRNGAFLNRQFSILNFYRVHFLLFRRRQFAFSGDVWTDSVVD